jgi:hypothetical protein
MEGMKLQNRTSKQLCKQKKKRKNKNIFSHTMQQLLQEYNISEVVYFEFKPNSVS